MQIVLNSEETFKVLVLKTIKHMIVLLHLIHSVICHF